MSERKILNKQNSKREIEVNWKGSGIEFKHQRTVERGKERRRRQVVDREKGRRRLKSEIMKTGKL